MLRTLKCYITRAQSLHCFLNPTVPSNNIDKVASVLRSQRIFWVSGSVWVSGKPRGLSQRPNIIVREYTDEIVCYLESLNDKL